MTKLMNILLLGAIISFFAASCMRTARQESAAGPSKAEQAASLIKGGAVVIDVRSPAEYAEGHVDGALNIPHTEIASRLAEIAGHQNDPIVLYCRSGRRAGLAEATLQEQGFTNVLNAGGYETLRDSLNALQQQ